jgi:hypothetical protein
MLAFALVGNNKDMPKHCQLKKSTTMSFPQTHSTIRDLIRRTPLRAVLVIPFVLQIFAAVGLTGYLSLRNGKQAINDVALQLLDEVSNRVDQHLDNYLALPHQINQINLNAINQGMLNPQDIDSANRYFWKQGQVFEQFSFIGYGLKE